MQRFGDKPSRGRYLHLKNSKLCKGLDVRSGTQTHKSNSSHRYELLNGEVVTEGSVSSVTPGLRVYGHAVFPFVFEQVLRQIAISTGIISSVGTYGTITPAIIGHNCVPNWTVRKPSHVKLNTIWLQYTYKKKYKIEYLSL